MVIAAIGYFHCFLAAYDSFYSYLTHIFIHMFILPVDFLDLTYSILWFRD